MEVLDSTGRMEMIHFVLAGIASEVVWWWLRKR